MRRCTITLPYWFIEGKGVYSQEKEEDNMILELTNKEKDMLIGVLKDYIPELRGEIASGVKHDLKMELKEEEAVLRGVLERLNALK